MLFNPLIITNTNNTLETKDLLRYVDEKPNIILALGNVSDDELEMIASFAYHFNLPFYGVCGSNDFKDTLNNQDVFDLDMRVINFNGLLIGGFGGSWCKSPARGNSALLTNDMASEKLLHLDRCDVLISHDCANFNRNETIYFNQGFIGLAEYIDRCSPKLHLHSNVSEPVIDVYKRTVIRGCFGIEMLNITL